MFKYNPRPKFDHLRLIHYSSYKIDNEWKKKTKFTINIYLTTDRKFEEEIENSIGDTSTQHVLKIHLVTLKNLIEILSSPAHHHPD